jgi:hypothetical protein
MTTTLDLQWCPGEDGGFLSANNPQARLRVLEDGVVQLTMLLQGEPNTCSPHGMELVLLRGGKRVTTVDPVAVQYRCAVTSPSSLVVDVTLVAGDYTVICCREQRAHEVAPPSQFSLHASRGVFKSFSTTGSRLRIDTSTSDIAGSAIETTPQQFFVSTSRGTPIAITVRVLVKSCETRGSEKLQFGVARTHIIGSPVRLWDVTSRLFTSDSVKGTFRVSGVCQMPEAGVLCVMPTLVGGGDPSDRFVVEVHAISDDDATLHAISPELCVRPAVESSAAELFQELLRTRRRPMSLLAKYKVDMYDLHDAVALVDTVNARLDDTQVFRDLDFGHDDRSVFNPSDAKLQKPEKGFCWRRPAELVGYPTLFGGKDSADILQGALGDCWFCAQAVALAQSRPKRLRSVFYPATYNPKGIYAVKLWVDSAWRAVIIDDALPSRKQTKKSALTGLPGQSTPLAFGHSRDPTEFWFALLEKAFAKVLRGYSGLIGGHHISNELNVMRLLVGADSREIYTYRETKQDWWMKAQDYLSNDWLVTSSTMSDGINGGDKKGIVGRHAYTILDVFQAGESYLLKCRNTWGSGSWTGGVGAASKWLAENPAVADECDRDGLGLSPAPKALVDDGQFWINHKDFVRYFAGISLHRVFDESAYPRQTTFSGSWPEKHPKTYQSFDTFTARQMILQFRRPGARVHVELQRGDHKKAALRFLVFVPPRRDATITIPATTALCDPVALRSSEAAFSTDSCADDRVTLEFRMPPNATIAVLVPLSDAGAGEFKLVVSSDEKCQVSRADEPQRSVCVLPWRFVAGRRRNGCCPKFRLQLPEPGPLSLTLLFDRKDKTPAPGRRFAFVLVAGEPGVMWPDEAVAPVAQASGSLCSTLSAQVGAADAAVYTLWVTREGPDEGRLTLDVSSTSRVSIAGS